MPASTLLAPMLLANTPEAWVVAVLADFDGFLQDHAAAEKKAAGMAISMASHYPDKPELVEAMADLAVEEMSHYREVVKLIHARGGLTAADAKDGYVIAFRKHLRKGSDAYFLDRLLVGGLVEARGAERFGIIGEHIGDQDLARFYRSLARSEQRHLQLFIDLSSKYFDEQQVQERLNELLPIEAQLMQDQPIQALLH